MGFMDKIFSKGKTIKDSSVYNIPLNLKKMSDRISKLQSIEEKLFLLDNYIFNFPGNFELLEYYRNFIDELIKNDIDNNNNEDLRNKYLWLSTFLKENSKFVDQKHAIDLFHMAIDYEKKGLSVEINENKKPTIELNKITSILSKSNNIEERNHDLLEHITEIINNVDDKNRIKELKNAKVKILKTIAFNDGLIKFEETLKESFNRKHHNLRGYYLQNCESILKDLSFLLIDLENNYEHILYKKTELLREEYGKFDIIRLKELANKVIKEFDQENKKDISTFKKVNKYKDKLTADIKCCATIVEQFTKQSINNFGNNFPDEINHYLDELQNILQKLIHIRQKGYEKWVLNQIETGYKNGLEGVGKVYDEKEQISKVIIEYFGHIDNTSLSYHLGRTYSECFEHLLGKLKVPSDETFTTKKSKLYVLKSISIMEKKNIESF